MRLIHVAIYTTRLYTLDKDTQQVTTARDCPDYSPISHRLPREQHISREAGISLDWARLPRLSPAKDNDNPLR